VIIDEIQLNDEQFSGDHEITADVSNLSAGVYVCRFAVGDHVSIRRIVVVR
jgi:hypothetical protein